MKDMSAFNLKVMEVLFLERQPFFVDSVLVRLDVYLFYQDVLPSPQS